ncbi:MAG: hypothetical protein QM760_01990 [Nibricoccus sp.]
MIGQTTNGTSVSASVVLPGRYLDVTRPVSFFFEFAMQLGHIVFPSNGTAHTAQRNARSRRRPSPPD